MLRGNRSENIAPTKAATESSKTRKELAELGQIRKQLVDEIDNLTKQRDALEDVSALVELKEVELSALEEKIGKINVDIAAQEKHLASRNLLLEDIESLKTDKKLLLTIVDELTAEVASLSDEKKAKEDELSKTISHLIQDVKLNQDALEAIKVSNVSVINGHNDSVKLLEEVIKEKQQTLSEINKEIKEQNTTLDTVINMVESAKIKLATTEEQREYTINSSDQYLEEMKKKGDEYYNSRVAEMEAREGACSDKERFLEIREQFLRDIKSQLEDKLGRKIDNIEF